MSFAGEVEVLLALRVRVGLPQRRVLSWDCQGKEKFVEFESETSES